ncbi:MAG: hypothetical protein GOMPHAMPRED_002598 [Gomphillus americanus]|uniref:Uncharacterized protein n=1 Tax=Gomphillus americanus TaxID=1940652 RepID=A0A8H3FDQ7_9LECA|nr:MAG: hypothetical protein GOMPHAMPRED_002598 [Gomphillus americanus]
MAGRESHSDDEHTLRDSIDVLKEEEDREQLLAGSRSTFASVFSPSDPNEPRKMTRKEMKKQERRIKANRKLLRDSEGHELLYEMEEGKDIDDSRSSSSSRSSIEASVRSNSRYQGNHKRRRLLVGILLFAIVGIMSLLILGAIKASNIRRTISPAPKIPKILLSNGTSKFAPTTILVSLDGFRADFLERGLTPRLNSLIAEGVSPRYMLPSFPSLTFPNHWTIMTGLHPESHGIVGNTFWDPALGEEFYYTDPLRSMQPKWWTSTGAEPLWSACELQGVRTAIHMWPGSEAGISPDPQTVDKYNGKEDLTRKVGRILSFLDRPSEFDVEIAAFEARPQFIAMYVPNIDADGHRYGPNSTEIRATIQSVDTMVGTLIDGINARNLTSVVNVIVVSDHGMATTSTSRLIQLDDLLDPSTIDHTDGWPLYGLRPKPNIDVVDLYKQLLLTCRGKNVTPYMRHNIPERYHFSNSERIAPLWLVPEPGYAIVPKAEFDVAAALKDNTIYHPRGLHGYDNQHPLMRAIFIARGPAFPHTPNSELEVFQNIEVYNIIADSLGVEPASNNGTLRLPLKPIGIHDGNKDVTEDMPADGSIDQPGTGESDEGKTDEDPSGIHNGSEGVAEDLPADGAAGQPEMDESDEEEVDEHPSGLIATLKDKFNDLRAWFGVLWDKYHW